MQHALAPNQRPQPQQIPDPVDRLVREIVGSQAAFERLRQRFPKWDLVVGADPAELARLIAPAAGAAARARQLPRALKRIEVWSGALDLDFLIDWDADMAVRWLTALPGVGTGIAAAVLVRH